MATRAGRIDGALIFGLRRYFILVAMFGSSLAGRRKDCDISGAAELTPAAQTEILSASAMPGSVFVMKLRLTVLLLLTLSQTACGQARDTGTPAHAFSNPLSGSTHALGNINGIKIAIPREFLLFGVTYKGENPWNPVARLRAPDFDTPIQHFSMLLRLSNFEPRRSPQDMAEWSATQRKVMEKREWTNIGIDAISDAGEKTSSEWLGEVLGRLQDPAYWFLLKRIDTDDQVFGLDHFYLVDEIPISENKLMMFPAQHYYVDRTGMQTYIVCNDPPENAVVKIHFCHQAFWVEKLNAIVVVNYEIDQLPRWKLIHQRVTAHLLSFVVNDKAVSKK